MARLMSQIKGGYYAAAPEAVAAVLQRLRPPDRGECLILDPCAGEGKALVQLAEGLKAVPYGIELSEDRAAMVRELLPEGQSLAPADFLRSAISYHSFSLVWCNPPYDYATGEEGRVESQFIARAADLLVDGGVLALICPPDEPPHVIRGTAAKDTYVASSDTTEDDDGNVTSRTVISERPRLVIRVLDSEGTITNLG